MYLVVWVWRLVMPPTANTPTQQIRAVFSKGDRFPYSRMISCDVEHAQGSREVDLVDPVPGLHAREAKPIRKCIVAGVVGSRGVIMRIHIYRRGPESGSKVFACTVT